MRLVSLSLALATIAGCSCGNTITDADAATPDAIANVDAASRTDTGPTSCTEDCHAHDDACHLGRCDEAAHACIIDDRDGSCDDGDPCTQTDQCLVGVCAGFPIAGCCTRDCASAMCGDDHCGGSCGTCATGMLCGGDRTCVAGALAGDTCAAPTEITSLPFHVTSTTHGLTDDYAVPDGPCSSGGFGDAAPDAVFRYHATSDGVLLVSLSGLGFAAGAYATTDCADLRYACLTSLYPFDLPQLGPMSVDTHAGQDVFIIVDGDGAVDGSFTIDVTGCTPDCTGAQCGTNGCGENCAAQCPITIEWSCSTARTCVCEPSCVDRACGSDGCSGSCGACATGQACDAHGRCVSAALPGDTAASAIPISSSPFTYSGDTSAYGNDATAWASCQGDGTNAYLGIDAPDVLFSLSPATPTTYYLALTTTDFLPAMYAVRDPSNILSCVEAGYEGFTLRDQLLVEASSAAPLFVVVDGDSDEHGHFTLTASACHASTDCPDASEGQFCSWPHVIGALPFSTSDTVGTLDAYRTPAGACGSTHAFGADGHDTAYALHATTSGMITVHVHPTDQYDPILYVTTDCQALATACLASADAAGSAQDESLTFAATAGATYYVVLDSFGEFGGNFDLSVTAH